MGCNLFHLYSINGGISYSELDNQTSHQDIIPGVSYPIGGVWYDVLGIQSMD